MSAKSLGKPLTMTVEREAWYRSARGIACAPLYVPDLLAEVDALRAALADEWKHADALHVAMVKELGNVGEESCCQSTVDVMAAHAARRAAEKEADRGCV